MKKLFMFLLSSLFLVFMSFSAFAAEPENELTTIKDDIIEVTNDLLSNEINRTISDNDVNLSNAYKIYVGTNIFQIDTNDANALEQLLEENGYIYELPIYVDGNTIIVNIAKGRPLEDDINITEEEKQEILQNTGKWHVSAVKLYKNKKIDYNAIISEVLGEEPSDIILVGGLPNFKFAVALLKNNDDKIDRLVPLSDVPGINTISKFKTDKKKNIYDYEQIKEYINSLPIDDPDLMTNGYGFPTDNQSSIIYIFKYGLIFVIIAGIGVFLLKKLRYNS